MANQVERQTVRDGFRNACFKWTGILDTSDFVLAPALAPGELVGNDPNLTFVGFRILSLRCASTKDLSLSLEWAGSVPQLIAVATNQDNVDASGCGGFSPNRDAAGYTGALNLRSIGYAPGTIATFTLVAEMAKIYR